MVLKLFTLLEQLNHKSKNNSYSKTIKEEAKTLYKDAKEAIKSETDLAKLEDAFLKF